MDPRRAEAILAENALLRERIAVLEGLLMDVHPLPVEWCLTGAEARMFGVMVNRPVATRAGLYHALYGADVSDAYPETNIECHVSRLRRKLKPFGISIESRRGYGYLLPEPIRAQFRVTSARPPSSARIPAAA